MPIIVAIAVAGCGAEPEIEPEGADRSESAIRATPGQFCPPHLAPYGQALGQTTFPELCLDAAQCNALPRVGGTHVFETFPAGSTIPTPFGGVRASFAFSRCTIPFLRDAGAPERIRGTCTRAGGAAITPSMPRPAQGLPSPFIEGLQCVVPGVGQAAPPPPNPVTISPGIFRVGGAVYLSNGADAVCPFVSPEHLSSCGGAFPPPARVFNALPSAMRVDAACQCGILAPRPAAPATISPGIFQVGGGVYLSNGADAVCPFVSPEHLSSCGGAFPPPARVFSALPSAMRVDAACQCGILAPRPAAPATISPGVFQVGGGVYLSNGADAVCPFISPAHLSSCGAAFPPPERIFSALPTRMRLDPACNCGVFAR